MEQTAIEFLVEKLKQQGLLIGEPDNLVAVRESKEIELQQMKSAFVGCWITNVPKGIECKVDFEKWFEQFKNK